MDKRVLKSATSPDQSPTPGYALSEISRATLSSYEACTQLEDFLITRINMDNPNIKFKCLVIIKHVCRTGRADFKRNIARKVAPIKKCIEFRGSADPLRGDEFNRRVREAAKDAIDAIFDDQGPISISAVAASNRIQGIGGVQFCSAENVPLGPQYVTSSNNNFSLLSADQSSYQVQSSSNIYANGNKISADNYCSSSAMVGIGNSPFTQSEKSWMQTAKDKVTSVGASASATAAAALGSSSSSSSSHSKSADSSCNLSGKGNRFHFMSNLSHSSDLLTSPTLLERTSGDVTSHAGKINPTAFSNPQLGNLGASNSTAGRLTNIQWRPDNDNSSNSNSSATGFQPFKGGAGLAASDGEYERALVSAICNHVGLKPTPSEEALRSFLCTARVLSPETVGLCLLEQLNSDHWQSRNKALVVIEGFFPSTFLCNGNSDDNYSSTGCLLHAQWWRMASNVDALQSMLSDTKASVRAQAGRTLGTVISSQDPSISTLSSLVDKNVGNVTAAVSYNSNSGVGSVPVISTEVQLIDWDEEIDVSNSKENIIVEKEKTQCSIEAREIANLLGTDVEEHGDLTHGDSSVSSTINDQLTSNRETSNLASTNETLLDRFDVSAFNSTCSTGGAPRVDDIFAGLTVTSSSQSVPSVPFNSTKLAPIPTSPLREIMSLPLTNGVSSTCPSTNVSVTIDGSNIINGNNNTGNHIVSSYSHLGTNNNVDIDNYGGRGSRNTGEGIFAVPQRLESSHPPILSVPLKSHFPPYPSSSMHTVSGAVCAFQENGSGIGFVNVYRGDSYSRSQIDHCSSNCESNSGFSFNPHKNSIHDVLDQPKFRDVSTASHSLENKSGSNNPNGNNSVDSFSFLSDVLKKSTEASASSYGNKR